MQPTDPHTTEAHVRFVARHYQPNRFDSQKAWVDMQKRLGKPAKRRSLPTYWRAAAAAAVALLLVAGIFYITGDRTERLMAKNERATFTLPDQTGIVMQQGAELTYGKRFGKNDRQVSMRGEIAFAVTHDPSKPFIVTTPVARVEVLGTEFTVNADDKETRLDVASGRVRFTPDDPVIPLLCEAGMAVHYRADTKTIEIIAPDSRMEVNGQTGRLSFDNVRLEEVVRILSFYYDTPLELPEEEATIPFSSSFTNQSLTDIIQIINFTLDTNITPAP